MAACRGPCALFAGWNRASQMLGSSLPDAAMHRSCQSSTRTNTYLGSSWLLALPGFTGALGPFASFLFMLLCRHHFHLQLDQSQNPNRRWRAVNEVAPRGPKPISPVRSSAKLQHSAIRLSGALLTLLDPTFAAPTARLAGGMRNAFVCERSVWAWRLNAASHAQLCTTSRAPWGFGFSRAV